MAASLSTHPLCMVPSSVCVHPLERVFQQHRLLAQPGWRWALLSRTPHSCSDHVAPSQPTCDRAAILALGAVSQGCATGLAPFLPEMVAMLLPVLKDPRPMVRCIRWVPE